MHADDRVRGDPQHLQAFEIWRHVGLADQHVAHADLVQMIAERRLADTQRPAVPVRAVRAHVAAGIERHPRGAADRRLHIGVGEPHAAFGHRIDVRRLQRRVPGATQIIIAKLVAHDPKDVFRACHELVLWACTSVMAEDLEQGTRAAGYPGLAFNPAASMPAMAQISSLSEVSPLTPTAPSSTSPSWISTPPGTGISRPCAIVFTALTK